MRNPYVNPIPMNPITPEECKIVEIMREQTLDTVINVWTKESYPFDEEDEKFECTAGFVVHTSELINGLYVGTKIYIVWYTSKKIKIEFYGSSI
ncbi:hypothetical protein ACJJIK_13590 [Microbulbifer sp. ZKSA006]|uniref:hypothetical protein n=1 Tax=Microbulbifer sp. ZKSA006 TaxID=3243390 RepID=UPI00403A3CB6